MSKVVIRFDKCGWNRVLMGPGAPRNGSLIPTGQTQIETGFDGTVPIGLRIFLLRWCIEVCASYLCKL